MISKQQHENNLIVVLYVNSDFIKTNHKIIVVIINHQFNNICSTPTSKNKGYN